MESVEIIGRWVHENSVPMGGGTMRITSVWEFGGDGSATLTKRVILENQGFVVSDDLTENTGIWSIRNEKLIVEIEAHSDSPFEMSITDSGELKMGKRGGTWIRETPQG